MKKLVSTLLTLSILILSTTEAYATPTCNSQVSNKSETSILAGQTLTSKQTSQIKSEIATLSNYHIDTSFIKKINVTSDGNEYTLDFDGVKETVLLERNDSKCVTIKVNAGEKCNVLSFEKNGNIILDGYKVNKIDSNPYGPSRVIWKREQSLSPMNGLKSSDYNQFVSSNQQNLALGEALDNLAIATLSALIGSLDAYSAIAISLTSIAKGVYDVLVEVNPKTEYLGCISTTYMSGASDYKYINNFYANKDCTGTSVKKISYAHYRILN